MIKAFKNFWKEYLDLCKASGSWMKRHWLGYIIFCIVTFVVTFGGHYIYDQIEYKKYQKAKVNVDELNRYSSNCL
jgi:hypothetical protein